jgi:hypothetical protein
MKDYRESTAGSEQNSQDRTNHSRDSPDSSVWTGQPVLDKHDISAETGQPMPVVLAGQSRQDLQDWSARTDQPGKVSQDRSACTGQPEQDILERSAGTG